ncbi:MAG: hypothetical protein PPHEINF_5758 [uncultured Paraburkholderia sp.]|nr:MAG: hypothetical protein PPHEINF_5758 [uncultured Paraburkholderia sp.]CAH2807099.1 MAG: hypothetical protein PPHEESC_5772 [uncultured Paraburkholderia sp.]CAH2942582.1 MAG: hypothetical protein PPHEMADMSA_5781 [uncultured Paraburkholderia sp.]CAH2943520.1 MAG: hypothetical protein PPHERAN_5801 [uncultured Paraburkholderia sp.]
MKESAVFAYVRAAAVAIGLPLDAVRERAVAQQFSRTVTLAAALSGVPLLPEYKLAEIYRAAPFPVKEDDA